MKHALRTIKCHECVRGTAINKADAHFLFHSKAFAKQRKARRTRSRNPPQVGARFHPTGALLDESFGEKLAPRTVRREVSDYIVYVALFIGVTTAVIAGIAYDIDGVMSYFELLFMLGLFLVAGKLGNLDMRLSRRRRVRYQHTWLCLRCGREWVE